MPSVSPSTCPGASTITCLTKHHVDHLKLCPSALPSPSFSPLPASLPSFPSPCASSAHKQKKKEGDPNHRRLKEKHPARPRPPHRPLRYAPCTARRLPFHPSALPCLNSRSLSRSPSLQLSSCLCTPTPRRPRPRPPKPSPISGPRRIAKPAHLLPRKLEGQKRKNIQNADATISDNRRPRLPSTASLHSLSCLPCLLAGWLCSPSPLASQGTVCRYSYIFFCCFFCISFKGLPRFFLFDDELC